MLSLTNTYSRDEIEIFEKRLNEAGERLRPIDFMFEPKIDGMAISLLYKGGQWIRA
jgi:DNA ligase (NAD+)